MTAGLSRDQGTVISGSGIRQARQAQAAHRKNRRALLVVALGTGWRTLRDRDFQARVITGTIAAAALASLAREGRDRNLARLAAWDRRQRLRQEVKAAPNR